METLSPSTEPVIAFVGLEPSDAIYAYAVKKIEPIAHTRTVQSCRVVLEAQNHAHAGHRFRAKVEIHVPGAVLVVGSVGEAFADVYAAVDDAASSAMRVVHDRTKRAEHMARG
jgi:ribosome-associated translation inhibitor RaiA